MGWKQDVSQALDYNRQASEALDKSTRHLRNALENPGDGPDPEPEPEELFHFEYDGIPCDVIVTFPSREEVKAIACEGRTLGVEEIADVNGHTIYKAQIPVARTGEFIVLRSTAVSVVAPYVTLGFDCTLDTHDTCEAYKGVTVWSCAYLNREGITLTAEDVLTEPDRGAVLLGGGFAAPTMTRGQHHLLPAGSVCVRRFAVYEPGNDKMARHYLNFNNVVVARGKCSFFECNAFGPLGDKMLDWKALGLEDKMLNHYPEAVMAQSWYSAELGLYRTEGEKERGAPGGDLIQWSDPTYGPRPLRHWWNRAQAQAARSVCFPTDDGAPEYDLHLTGNPRLDRKPEHAEKMTPDLHNLIESCPYGDTLMKRASDSGVEYARMAYEPHDAEHYCRGMVPWVQVYWLTGNALAKFMLTDVLFPRIRDSYGDHDKAKTVRWRDGTFVKRAEQARAKPNNGGGGRAEAHAIIAFELAKQLGVEWICFDDIHDWIVYSATPAGFLQAHPAGPNGWTGMSPDPGNHGLQQGEMVAQAHEWNLLWLADHAGGLITAKHGALYLIGNKVSPKWMITGDKGKGYTTRELRHLERPWGPWQGILAMWRMLGEEALPWIIGKTGNVTYAGFKAWAIQTEFLERGNNRLAWAGPVIADIEYGRRAQK